MNTSVELRPYQEAAIRGGERWPGILPVLRRNRSALYIAATGTGKTTVAGEVVRRYQLAGYRSLWLAHRDELLEQAIGRLEEMTGVPPEKDKADQRASREAKTVVASIQTLYRDSRLRRFPKDHFQFVVYDEAHHAVSDTSQKILEHFGDAKVLGMTATPDRADDKALGAVFDEVAYQYSLLEAIRDDYLVPIVGRKVSDFEIDLSALRTVAGDFLDKELEEIVAEYIGPLAKSIVDETRELKTMVFLPSVRASELMAEALIALGIDAAYLSGKSSPEDRQAVLQQYRDGAISHLCNCNLFLEGFDEPSIECIAMCRPTMSRTVYAQAVGRGTRKHPGKTDCLLLEFTWNSDQHKLVTAYELFASGGYEEKVRDRAAAAEDGGDVNYLLALEHAHAAHYDVAELMKRVQVERYGMEWFDPFALADLAGQDLTGELEIHYQGRKLEGPASVKQLSILSAHHIDNPGLDKAQASLLISLIAQNGWSTSGLAEKLAWASRGSDTPPLGTFGGAP